MKRTVILLVTIAFGLSFSLKGQADVYPNKPVEVIVPYAAGGGVDVNARILAEHAKKHLGQPLLVVNRVGGGGAIGFSAGAQARPDGYTVIMITNPSLTDEFLLKGAQYTYKSFAPILQVASDPAVLVVQKGGAFDRPLKEFLENARKNPQQIRIGQGGNWSFQDMTRALLEREAKVKFTRVPFSGGAPAVTALLGGHIDVAVAYIAEFRGYYDSKKIQPLAVTGDQRSTFLPEIPTFKELGLPLTLGVWRIMAAPAATPPLIIQTLEGAFRKAMDEPAALEAFKKAGINVLIRDSKETQRFLDEQHRFYSQIIKEFGLEPK